MPGEGVLIITDDKDRHGYFAQALLDAKLPVAGIILGAKRRRSPAAPIAFADLAAADADALRAVKRQRLEAERRMFAGQAERLRRDRRDLVVAHVEASDGDINAWRFVRLVEQLRPAVVAVMGAAMLRAPMLATGVPFVNLHTGLSPYYRGGRSNMWPIVECDYGHFGATIHRIAPGIDDGEIFASRRVLVRPHDTYASVNGRAIRIGTTAMIEVLDRLLGASEQRGVPQWLEGKLFMDRDYTPAVARRYLAQCEAFMAEHLRRQAHGDLPELRLIG